MGNHVKLPAVITPSRAELGARCYRRHFLSDVLNKAKYHSASLEFGSVIHAAAAAKWLKRDYTQVLRDEWAVRFDAHPEISQDNVSLQMADAMMGYYDQNALLAGPFSESNPEEWQLVDVEQRFELPLKDGVLSFQTDRAAFHKGTNHLVIVDTKTAGRLDARWEKQWETSLQMKLYRAGAMQVYAGSFERIDVVIEGVLKTVPSKLRYYVCPEWSEGLLAEALFNAHSIADMDAQLISQCMTEPVLITGTEDRIGLAPDLAKVEELAVRFTPVNYADCYAYGVECPFRPICTSEIDERVSLLRGEYFESTEELY